MEIVVPAWDPESVHQKLQKGLCALRRIATTTRTYSIVYGVRTALSQRVDVVDCGACGSTEGARIGQQDGFPLRKIFDVCGTFASMAPFRARFRLVGVCFDPPLVDCFPLLRVSIAVSLGASALAFDVLLIVLTVGSTQPVAFGHATLLIQFAATCFIFGTVALPYSFSFLRVGCGHLVSV